MPDREKVINGLSKCGRVHRSLEDCAECPYKLKPGHYAGLECWCRLCDDALELLKEQEARVLTLEELHSDLWIWMEYPGEEEGYGNYIGYAYLEGRMIEDWWFLTAGAKERLVCPLKSYGQVWRCWTSRPTPEQMRDTP